MSRSRHAVFAAVALLTACDRTRPLSTNTDSAGVAIVTGPTVDVPLPWALTEVRRLGGADSGALGFTVVSARSVRTDGRNRIAVLDWQGMQRIHLFDSAGVLQHSLSAPGAGPGEMQFPLGIVFDREGALAAVDMAKRAVLTWGPDGALRGERSWPTGAQVPWGMPEFAGDTILTLGMDQDSVSRWMVLRRWTPQDTVVIDSLTIPPMKMTMFSCAALMLAPLHMPQLLWSRGDGVVAITTQQEYVIDVHDGTGLRRSVRRAIPATATTLADAATLYPKGLVMGDCVIPAAEVAEKAGMARTRPLIAAMRFGPDGELWVQRANYSGETPMLDVFGREGNYLGTLRDRVLPLGFLGKDLVLFPVDDPSTGGQVIGIYRLARQEAR